MNSIQETLTKASEDLYWVSEADYPFEVIVWSGDHISEKQLLEQLGYPSDFAIQKIDIDEFFQWAVEGQDWHNEVEKAEVKRYQNLVKTLKENLSDLQVYKVGEIELDIYILGKTASGKIAGLSTKVVET